MRQIETRHWRRITKTKAKKLYEEGTTILLVPHKVLPENVWGIGSELIGYNPLDFETVLNTFCWYNCQHNELGKYPAFYERKCD